MLWALDIAFSASGSGVSIPQKTVLNPASRIRARMSVARAMLSVASQARRTGVAVRALPLDQVRKQVLGRLAVGDEVVVDEIDVAVHAAGEQLVELGRDLLGRLQARDAAVEPRDVAELALVGAAAGELDAAQKVAVDLGQLVGRLRELGQRPPLARGQHHLPCRAGAVLLQPGEQLVGGVAELADVQVVELRIELRAGRHRGPAQHRRLAREMGPPADVLDLAPLDVHAADEHHVGPGEIRLGRAGHVLVDEADLPVLRQGRGDDQQPLRRHEGLHAVGQLVRIVEGAEGRRVPGRHAQRAAGGHRSRSILAQSRPRSARRARGSAPVRERHSYLVGSGRDDQTPVKLTL